MKRQAILNTAARLFAERGFHNTPTMLLAQEAGVSEGTIFRHFKSKDDIYFELVETVRARLMEELQKSLSRRMPANGLAEILAIAREFCIIVRRNPMEFNLVFRDATARVEDENDKICASFRALYDQLAERLQIVLQHGLDDGSISPTVHVPDTALLLVCQLVGFVRGLRFSKLMREAGESRIVEHMITNWEKILAH